MSRLRVITDPLQVTGFRLAGVEAFGVADPESAAMLIEAWLDAGETGLLAIDEGLLANMDAAFIRRLQAAEHLPYLAIPGGTGQGFQRQRIAEMIRRTTGFHITFKGEPSEGEQP